MDAQLSVLLSLLARTEHDVGRGTRTLQGSTGPPTNSRRIAVTGYYSCGAKKRVAKYSTITKPPTLGNMMEEIAE
jgi:hypothetical protein